MLISHLWLSPLNSTNMYKPKSSSAAQIVVFDSSGPPLSYNAHHSIPAPSTWLEQPALSSGAHPSASTGSTCLWHPPLGFDAHHWDPMPTVQVWCPPVASNGHYSHLVPTT